MPDLNRNQIRIMLKYLEDTTEMDYRHLRRVLENPRALLKGTVDTKEERKFGKVIRVQEQKEFFERLSEEMKLSGRAREKFEWATNSRNIGATLRNAKEHASGKGKGTKEGDEDGGGDDDKLKPKGFFGTMMGY